MNILFEKVAVENGTTAENVYQEIQSAISLAMLSSDISVQRQWRSMSPTGQIPTPDEAVRWILTQLTEDKSSS